MRACEIRSSLSTIRQGDTLGGAKSFLAECVVNVFLRERKYCMHSTRTTTSAAEGGKRDAAPLEMLRHNVEARGSQEVGRSFKHDLSIVQVMACWMTACSFRCVKICNHSMKAHLDNRNDEHAGCHAGETLTDSNYHKNTRRGLCRVLLRSQEPGKSSYLLMQDAAHSDAFSIWQLKGIVAVNFPALVFDTYLHAHIGVKMSTGLTSEYWTFTVQHHLHGLSCCRKHSHENGQHRFSRGIQRYSSGTAPIFSNFIRAGQLHEDLWPFLKQWRKTARKKKTHQATLTHFRC